MRKMMIIVLGVACVSCATKAYPVADPLSDIEAGNLSCIELYDEMKKIEQIETEIRNISRFDWRSVIGYLNDLGIGNTMVLREAVAALQARQEALEEVMRTRQCDDEDMFDWTILEGPVN